MRTTLISGTILLCIGCANITSVWAQSADTAYAKNLGDGLRLYTESDYSGAVKHLFRAYALKPKPSTLGFIVRAYDFMGHCSAAKTQLQFMAQAHAQSTRPKLQKCATPATLTLTCNAVTGPIELTRHLHVQCGQRIEVAPGQYTLKNANRSIVQTIKLSGGQKKALTLEHKPRKWPKTAVARRPAKKSRAFIQRLEDPQRYTMTLSADGLYEIWIPKRNAPPVCAQSDGERVCGRPTKTIVIPRLQ